MDNSSDLQEKKCGQHNILKNTESDVQTNMATTIPIITEYIEMCIDNTVVSKMRFIAVLKLPEGPRWTPIYQ